MTSGPQEGSEGELVPKHAASLQCINNYQADRPTISGQGKIISLFDYRLISLGL